MSRKPMIGITVAHYTEEIKTFPRAFYVESVSKAGGQPILLPPVHSKEEALEVLEFLEGMILTGGGDVSPLLLGEQPKRGIGDVLPERDRSEILLAQLAMERNLPLLGICRGIQVMAAAAGGTIVQDIRGEYPESIEHSQTAPRESAWHEVKISESRLYEMIRKDRIAVNSFHHQAVASVPEEFIQNAVAPDGIIEGIEKLGAAFCIGVQWHPEAMVGDEQSLKLFRGFIQACEN